MTSVVVFITSVSSCWHAPQSGDTFQAEKHGLAEAHLTSCKGVHGCGAGASALPAWTPVSLCLMVVQMLSDV